MTINLVDEAMAAGNTVVFDYHAEPLDGDIVLAEVYFACHRIRQFRRIRFNGDEVVFESDVEDPIVQQKWFKGIERRIIGKVVGIREGHPEKSF